MKVKEKIVKMYVCECGEEHRTKVAAARCEKQHEKARDESKRRAEDSFKRDQLRLAATSPSDFFRRIEQFCKDEYGEDVTIRFTPITIGNCATSHCAPIGQKPDFRGDEKRLGVWGGVEMSKTPPEGEYISGSGPYRFPGFNTGSGGGGYNSGWDVVLFAEDFPIWGPKVQQYIDACKERDADEVENSNRSNELRQAMQSAQAASEVIADLERRLAAEHKKVREKVRAERTDLALIDMKEAKEKVETLREELR